MILFVKNWTSTCTTDSENDGQQASNHGSCGDRHFRRPNSIFSPTHPDDQQTALTDIGRRASLSADRNMREFHDFAPRP